ncbi:MAG TPA: hypothetical protein VJT74_13555 [Pyrinomonadaceae bacterium]|nr:hypothetical protein [Pyrinomonadaceae bacterium]
MRRKILCTVLLFWAATAGHAPAAAQHARPAAEAGRKQRALWPGSRFTDADRRRAVMRGLRFIYRTALDRRNFEDYGHDYLWCFYSLSAAVRDPAVRSAARGMGLERARFWRHNHRAVPLDAGAATIANLAYGADAADSLGVHDAELKRQLVLAAPRYTARDYLLFDPRVEPPPADVPDECGRCGALNGRGSTVCRVCRAPLVMRTRYDVWYDALITAYVGERSGVNLGARYADVLKWLPTLRPYRALPTDAGEEFHDTVYAVTHVVYTLNDYSRYRLSPRLLPQEFEFLKANLRAAIADDDADMLGEFMDSLRAFGVTTADPLMRAGMEYYLTHQNPDGSWGAVAEKDIYLRYHPTWNAVAGLSEYGWRGEGLSFPEVRPLLEKWARTESSAVFNFMFGKSSPEAKSARIQGGG